MKTTIFRSLVARNRARTLVGAVAVSALAGGVSVSAYAAAPAESEGKKADDNSCVFIQSVQDWRALDSRNLVVWAPNRRDAYHVTLSFPIAELRTEENVAFVDGNNDSQLCGFGMDQVVTRGVGGVPQKASVSGVTRLDEAGLAALGAQYNVKLSRSADKDENKDDKAP